MRASKLVAEIVAMILEHGDAEILMARSERTEMIDAEHNVTPYYRMVALGTVTEVEHDSDDEFPMIVLRGPAVE